MNESDFSQFPDPRVRAVMAAAANLVEAIFGEGIELEEELDRAQDLKTALLAAQPSKPKDVHVERQAELLRIITDEAMPAGVFALVNTPDKDKHYLSDLRPKVTPHPAAYEWVAPKVTSDVATLIISDTNMQPGEYRIMNTSCFGGCPSCQRGLGEFCEKCCARSRRKENTE